MAYRRESPWKADLTTIVKRLFAYFLITYLLLLIFEQFKPGFAGDYLHLNYFLVFIIITGVIVLLIGDYKESDHERKKAQAWYRLIAGIAGLVGAILIFSGILYLSGLAFFIALVTGILIYVVSLVVLYAA